MKSQPSNYWVAGGGGGGGKVCIAVEPPGWQC